MKKKITLTMIQAVIVAVLVVALAFFFGMQYQKSRINKGPASGQFRKSDSVNMENQMPGAGSQPRSNRSGQ